MGFDADRTIDALGTNACPSIRYRLRREILGEDPRQSSMEVLQGAIGRNWMVRAALRCQQHDGYLGDVFHAGIDFTTSKRTARPGAEGILRFLHEMGLDLRNEAFRKGVEALKRDDWHRPGKGNAIIHYPELGMYGPDFQRCTVLALIQSEDESRFGDHISHALQIMAGARWFDSWDQLTRLHNDRGKTRLVFKEGVRFPEIYHLRMLAYTRCWRTDSNRKILAEAVDRLIDLSPILPAKILHRGTCLGPATIFPSQLDIHLAELRDATLRRDSWADWFHTYELLARMGVVQDVPRLRRQADELAAIMAKGGGFFRLPLAERHFRRWGPFAGLALEDEWTDDRRTWDLTFRSLLILHHTGAV